MAEGKRRKSKLDPFADKIGILSDKMIAEMAGVSGENVRAHRKRREIPARWRGEGELMPNETAILEDAGLPPSPAPKKATKKRKAAKPKAKKAPAMATKAPAKVRKAPAKPKKPRAKKAKLAPVMEVEPVLDAVVEAEPAQVPVSEVEPVVEAEPVAVHEPEVAEDPETVVAAEPTPEPGPTPAPKASPTPAKIRKPRKTKLDPYMDKVGVLSDREVAELAGVSSQNVRAYRKRRGIPAQWRGVAAVPKAAATKAPKSKAPQKAAAKRKPRRGKLTPFLDKIGTVPDARIAEMAGTSHANVRAFRLRHDIPARWRGEGAPLPTEPAAAPQLTLVPTPAPVPAAAPRGRKPRRGKLTPFMEQIGILSDSVLGDKAETTAQNVRAFRIRHGIPARWRGEGQPLPNEEAILAQQAGPQAIEEPAPVIEPVLDPVVEAAPVPELVLLDDDNLLPEVDAVDDVESALMLKGYKVKVVAEDEKTTFVVTGSDIVEAAQNAVAALAQHSTDDEVVELRFLANMLGA